MGLRSIFYDTETTGLFAGRDRIIEIAALDTETGKTFETLVNPEIPISQESIDICQITNEMVAEAPTFAKAGKDFLEFIGKDSVLIAHNNDAFDLPFLKAEYQRVGIDLPELTTIDSLKWARKYRPDLPKHALQYLREIYQITENQAHRALNDVVILKQVFLNMIDDLDIETVISLLKEKPKASRMPFGKYKGHLLKDLPRSYISWMGENGVFDKDDNKALREELVKLELLT